MLSQSDLAEIVLRRLIAFLRRRFKLSLEEAREEHIRAFVDFCIDPPASRLRNKFPLCRPLRVSLVDRLNGVSNLLRGRNSKLLISKVTMQYAERATQRYVVASKGARSASTRELRSLVSSIDTSLPVGLRLRAAILLFWAAWARPREILDRRYPEDVCADYEEGIVLSVPRSKTNVGPHAERFAIGHEARPELCAVCALKAWLNWLGPKYRGPLFPIFRGGKFLRAQLHPVSTLSINQQLNRAQSAACMEGRRFTTYSFRKGPATTAAARGWPLADIQEALRHRNFITSASYIDTDVLTALMKDPLV